MEPNITNALFNASASIISLAYAHWNRYGNLKNIISKRIPKISESYNKISPTLEHFVWGFALTTGSYAYGEFAEDIQKYASKMYEIYPNLQQTFDSQTYSLTGGAVAIIGDALWEGNQALNRKKIKPEQFIGTCLGVATGIVMNNL